MLVFRKSFYQALSLEPDLSDTSISAQCKADFPSEHTHGGATGAEEATTHILQGKHKPRAAYNKSSEASFARGKEAAWIDKGDDTEMQGRCGFGGRNVPPVFLIFLITRDICGLFLIDRPVKAKSFSTLPGSLACRNLRLCA